MKNIKKISIFLLVILAICFMSLVSCSKKSDDSPKQAQTKKIKIGMVTDLGGIKDQSFNQTSWEGLQKAGKELGIDVQYLESRQDSDYATNIQTFLDEDYDLIICVGYMLADATRKAALEHPEQKFAIIDDSSNEDLPNVACLMFEQATASYLVGRVAGMMTKTNRVGFVIGMATGPMNEFGYGYLQGVRDANPNCKVEQYNANSFADPASGQTAARSMQTKGADIIFAAAGGTGSGVITGCQQLGIYAIGVDTDQNYIAPKTILTSAMKRVDNASYDIAKAILEGRYKAGKHVYGLESGGVDLAPTDTLLPENVKITMAEVKKDIMSGKIKVAQNKADFEKLFGTDYYTLD